MTILRQSAPGFHGNRFLLCSEGSDYILMEKLGDGTPYAIRKFPFSGGERAAFDAYDLECFRAAVDARPNDTTTINFREALSAMGWARVNTWQESHGACTVETWEKGTDFSDACQQIHLTLYPDARMPEMSTVANPEGSYTLARAIRANPNKWEIGAPNTSACGTAGFQDARNKRTKDVYRLYSVVGHGEWAFALKE